MDTQKSDLVNTWVEQCATPDTNSTYPVKNGRLKSIITKLISQYQLQCKKEPIIHCTKLHKNDLLESTSTVVEMILVHVDKNGECSSPTNINLYFDSLIYDVSNPKYSITVILKNKFKEAIYRPHPVISETDVVEYVDSIFNELSHKL